METQMFTQIIIIQGQGDALIKAKKAERTNLLSIVKRYVKSEDSNNLNLPYRTDSPGRKLVVGVGRCVRVCAHARVGCSRHPREWE